jgi:hypothetical protein
MLPLDKGIYQPAKNHPIFFPGIMFLVAGYRIEDFAVIKSLLYSDTVRMNNIGQWENPVSPREGQCKRHSYLHLQYVPRRPEASSGLFQHYRRMFLLHFLRKHARHFSALMEVSHRKRAQIARSTEDVLF